MTITDDQVQRFEQIAADLARLQRELSQLRADMWPQAPREGEDTTGPYNPPIIPILSPPPPLPQDGDPAPNAPEPPPPLVGTRARA